MPRIRTDRELNFSDPKNKHSYRITPEMGVVKHFPSKVCAALVEKGAEYVGKKKPTGA